MKSDTIPLIIKILIGCCGYAVWAFMAYHDPSLRPDFLKFNIMMAAGTIGLVLRDMASPGSNTETVTNRVGDISVTRTGPVVLPSAPPPGQAGYASWSLLFVLGLIACGVVMVSGCTTTTASMYSGFYTQAKAGVQVFDDNTLNTTHDLLCAQPYSAIQRHPEMQPGLVALCGPLVNIGSLDPAQISLMFTIAKQLNLVPGPQPAPK